MGRPRPRGLSTSRRPEDFVFGPREPIFPPGASAESAKGPRQLVTLFLSWKPPSSGRGDRSAFPTVTRPAVSLGPGLTTARPELGGGGDPVLWAKLSPGVCSRRVLHEGAGVGCRGCEAGDLGHGRPGEVPQRLSLVLQGRQWGHLGVRHHQEGEAPPGRVPTRLREAPASLSQARGR